MSQTTYDANSILMGGGAGNPAWKFDQPNPGQPRVGTITEPPQARQERDYDKNNPGAGAPKTYPSGDPIMGILVTVQTDERIPSDSEDDGKRTFYIEGRYLKEAVRGAIREAGAPGLEVGGQLHVEFTHREDPMDKRSRKFWQIRYTPAGNAALMADQPTMAAAAPPAAQPAPTSAQAPTPAPAAAPAANPAAQAQQLIAVGLGDEQIAAATGLDPAVVAAIRAA